MRKRIEYAALVLVLAALGFNIYLNLHTSRRLSMTVSESAQTRVTTVTQRCALTQKVANFALLSERVIVRFAPQSAPPFSKAYAGFESSYQSCETQLVTVRAIAHQSP